ncbi:hypothetical protein [Nocardioides panacisoli]|uniref:Uncharacterized protein n=1 Tax=Nocardioides panacisoli TaxID=627624 RepID=A0ABP7IRP0_9ACTN
MNDLTDLLAQASEPDDRWSVAPEALLREGRSRVRRRRIVATGAAVAVALAAAAAVARPPW